MNEALLLLALVWAGVLVPSVLRSRNSSPHATVGGFERAMDVLRNGSRGASHRQVFVPGDAGRVVEREDDDAQPSDDEGPLRVAAGSEASLVARRRRWFERALAGTGASLLLALIVGGWMWWLFALVAGLSGAYVGVLRRLKVQRDQARTVVRDLHLPSEEPVEEDLAVGDGDEPVAHGTVRLRRWDD